MDQSRDARAAESGVVRVDQLEDFLNYSEKDVDLGEGLSPQDMLVEAIRRRTDGEHCLTCVVEGMLTGLAWMRYPARELQFYPSIPSCPVPAETAVVYELRQRRSHATHLESLLRSQISLAAELGAKRLIMSVRNPSVEEERTLVALGGNLFGRLRQSTRAGHRRVTWTKGSHRA